MDKKECRAMVLSALAKTDEKERLCEDCKIYKNIVELKAYKEAKTVFLYISVGYEVDTRRLVENAIAQGKRVAIPRCIGKGIMDAVAISSLDELVSDKYDIPSAPPDNPVILPNELDMVLVPGVAFDRNGNRLGRGGGYYDRYLAKIPTSVPMVGICRATQLVSRLETDELDRKVNCVVTADEIFEKIGAEDASPAR